MQNTSIGRLKALALSDTGFVFDPRTGHSYTVNSTGLVVLRALKEGTPLSELSLVLAESYTQKSEFHEDVRAFVVQLAELGLVPSLGVES